MEAINILQFIVRLHHDATFIQLNEKDRKASALFRARS